MPDVFRQVQRTRQVATFEYSLPLGQQSRDFHATLSPLVSSTQQPDELEGALSVTREVTDAKRAEVELQIEIGRAHV